MKKTFYLVGVQSDIDLDRNNPIDFMMSHFMDSKYANGVKKTSRKTIFYSQSETYKITTEPLSAELFKDNPDGLRIHLIVVIGTPLLQRRFRKYFLNPQTFERWKYKPYLRYKKGVKKLVTYPEWYDEAFKEYWQQTF